MVIVQCDDKNVMMGEVNGMTLYFAVDGVDSDLSFIQYRLGITIVIVTLIAI